MKRVLFDSTIFDLQIFGGVSRYFTELISRAKKNNLVTILFKLVVSNNEYAKHSNLTTIKSNLHHVKIKGFKRLSWKVNSFLNSFYTNYHLRRGDFDFYHPTYYSKKSVRYSKKHKTILTVYDMIHEKFPTLFEKADEVIDIKKQLIFNSVAIIAISENTKRDILFFYPEISENKIKVTHLASSINEYKPQPIVLPFNKHIVFVGNRDGYKNFLPMLKTIAPMLLSTSDLGLICVGGGEFKNDEQVAINTAGLQNKVLQKNLSDEQLKSVYTRAIALLFPSEYEGFGIPVIEAFECGCPVILPELSSFPEIGGDAGLFYEKENMTKITEYLEKLLTDGSYRESIVSKSKNQATQFSWEKMKNETIEIYNSI